MKRIGYIGLGIMGAPMAANLIKAGFELVVWNRTPQKAQPLVDAGATAAASPAELAATVEAVCINVTATDDVEQVIFGSGGIVEGNPGDTADLLVIDHSTIDPGATRDFAERLDAFGVHLLDAPVSGGDVGAHKGTLSIMVGGRREAFDRARPLFEAVGQTITHCGPSGAGQATKACNQVLVTSALLGVCEALALAKAEGLDLDTVIKVTTGGAASSWQLANLGPRIAQRDFDPGFMIDLVNKDLGIAGQVARAHGLPLPGATLVAELFRAAAANGHGRDGTQALAAVIEQLGGFRFDDDEAPANRT